MTKFRTIQKKSPISDFIPNPENKFNKSPIIKNNNIDKLPKEKNNIFLLFVGKFIGYLKFELNSAITTEVSKKVFEARKEQCLKCPGLAKSPQDPIGYCKLCGCGMNPRARLNVKLTVAGATCPKKLWKPVRGKFSVKNFMKSLLGISQTVWYNLKQLCKSKKHN